MALRVLNARRDTKHNMFIGALIWVLLYVAPASAVVSPCPIGQCFTAAGCTTSGPGIECVECETRGWLSGTSCVCDPSLIALDATCAPIAVSNPEITNSICNLQAGECEIDPGVCGTSKFGSRCAECLRQGFVVPTVLRGITRTYICECYSPEAYDRDVRCAEIFNRTQIAALQSVQSIAWVEAHNNKRLGCWKNNTRTHDYGDPNPPIPEECCREIMGPGPNTQVAGSIGVLSECNTYVWPDPDGNDTTTKYTCANHGTWLPDPAEYRCECNSGWKLTDSGLMGVDGYNAFVCSECSGWSGPPQPLNGVAMCSAPWTPDPITGDDAICSGHGQFLFGACQCLQDDVLGHWDLVEMTQEFREYRYELGVPTQYSFNSTVRTCAGCAYGWLPLPDGESATPCTISTMTKSPTPLPSAAPTPGPVVELFEYAYTEGNFSWTPGACDFGCDSGVSGLVIEVGGMSLADLFAFYGFADDVRVVSPLGTLVAANWSSFAAGQTTNMDDVIGTSTYWIGGCDQFSNSSAIGVVRWLNGTDEGAWCDSKRAVVCACAA